jgi:preprotein translocase subunit YajC
MIVFFAQDAEATGSGISSLYLFLLLGVAFYFLLIRPQRRRAAKQQELIASIAVGDQVRTVGGLRGTIESLDDDSALLRLAEGSVEIERRAIASRIEQSTPEE